MTPRRTAKSFFHAKLPSCHKPRSIIYKILPFYYHEDWNKKQKVYLGSCQTSVMESFYENI